MPTCALTPFLQLLSSVLVVFSVLSVEGETECWGRWRHICGLGPTLDFPFPLLRSELTAELAPLGLGGGWGMGSQWLFCWWGSKNMYFATVLDLSTDKLGDLVKLRFTFCTISIINGGQNPWLLMSCKFTSSNFPSLSIRIFLSLFSSQFYCKWQDHIFLSKFIGNTCNCDSFPDTLLS